jgi:hypothetical protein
MAQFTNKNLRDAEIALRKVVADEFYYDHDLAMKCDQLVIQIQEMAKQIPLDIELLWSEPAFMSDEERGEFTEYEFSQSGDCIVGGKL